MCRIIFLYFLVAANLLFTGEKSICIFTYKDLRAAPWDPDSIKSGITGSEEAVIYMSKQLALLGHRVTVLGNPPAGSRHSLQDANPRFIPVEQDDGTLYDIAISWRMANIAEGLKKRASKVYLWPHDTNHTKLTADQILGFDDVLWLSDWQREQWVSINPEFARFTNIFGNGINPEQYGAVEERVNPYSCIYSSNYARGLEILLDIWPHVKAKFPRATLDVYYGWQHWGLLSQEKEAKMREQIASLSALDVVDHGLVSHEELNTAYEATSLWTYPCIAPETFCIAAIRAQVTGCIPVIIEGSALKETVRFGYTCNSVAKYLPTLLKAMEEVEQHELEERKKMGEFVLDNYTWQTLAQEWDTLFEEAQKAA